MHRSRSYVAVSHSLFTDFVVHLQDFALYVQVVLFGLRAFCCLWAIFYFFECDSVCAYIHSWMGALALPWSHSRVIGTS